jgi:hypothetical protein
VIKQGLSAVFLVLATQTLLAEGSSADNKPNLALVMWSAFSCATYAEISGNKPEQERLFEVGYNAGRTFVDGFKNKTITETEAKDAPLGVLMLLSGPTTDFIIGRIFESATEDAYDKVVKENSAGLPILDPSKWADSDLKINSAKNKYQSSNCALIQAGE